MLFQFKFISLLSKTFFLVVQVCQVELYLLFKEVRNRPLSLMPPIKVELLPPVGMLLMYLLVQ